MWNIEALVAGTEDESMSLVPKVAPPEPMATEDVLKSISSA